MITLFYFVINEGIHMLTLAILLFLYNPQWGQGSPFLTSSLSSPPAYMGIGTRLNKHSARHLPVVSEALKNPYKKRISWGSPREQGKFSLACIFSFTSFVKVWYYLTPVMPDMVLDTCLSIGIAVLEVVLTYLLLLSTQLFCSVAHLLDFSYFPHHCSRTQY